MLAELGVPLKTIMQRVGYNDPNTTLSIYTYVTKSMHDDVINKLNQRQAYRGNVYSICPLFKLKIIIKKAPKKGSF